MSELIAWGDESVQTQGGVIPTYYMGACICGLEERDIRRQLLSATKRKVSKLHWRDMTLSEKRRSIPVIEALSLPHIAIAATPLDGTVTSERARRKCLELLLPTLEKEYGISRLVLESRETSQDDRDLMFVRGLRSRRFHQPTPRGLRPGLFRRSAVDSRPSAWSHRRCATRPPRLLIIPRNPGHARTGFAPSRVSHAAI